MYGITLTARRQDGARWTKGQPHISNVVQSPSQARPYRFYPAEGWRQPGEEADTYQ